MRIADVLRRKGDTVVTVRSDATVTELLDLLAEHRIGAVVVSDGDARVDGMVSERDIVRHLRAAGGQVREARVRELMTRDVVTCSPSTASVPSWSPTTTRGWTAW